MSAVGIALSHVPNSTLLIKFVLVAILAGYIGVIMVQLIGQSRIFYAMSRDKLLPSSFSSLHKKFHTPWKSNLLFAVFTGVIAAFVPQSVVGQLTSIGALAAFILVCSSVIVLRRIQPNRPRPFKTPFYPWVPILGILSCVALTFTLPTDTWLRLLIWMVLGLIVFFSYSIKKVRAAKMESQNQITSLETT